MEICFDDSNKSILENVSNSSTKSRNFNTLYVDIYHGICRKTSKDEKKLINEINWFNDIPKKLKCFCPNIYEFSTEKGNSYYDMEYYTYSTIHNLLIHKKISSLEEWTKVFEILKFVLNDFKEYKLLKDTEVVSDLKNIYLDKTERRLSLLEQDETFKKFFENDIVINGVTYKNLNEIKSTLLKEIEKLLLTPRQFSILHGDLCFPNIIIDTTLSFVKLIDPRGSFGKFDIFGDTLYDYAKVFHSIDGKYDFIIEDMFTLVYDLSANVVNFKVLDNLDVDLVEIYKKTFKGEKGFDFKKIQLIEAILFLTMIPLHSESLEHQLVFLGTGIEILNKVVDIRK